MSKGAGLFLAAVKTLVEHSVNAALDFVAPPRRPHAVPVVALAEREWRRAAARRQRLSAR